jgi:hypothetical protein
VAQAEAVPDMRLHWRAATAIFVVGAVAAGFGFGADGRAAREMSLGPEPPSTTTSTAPAPPAGFDLATSEIPPEENAPAASVPSSPEPGPEAAGPTTTTSARPARTSPKPTTTTTAPGTIESRGAAAMALIDYPWRRTGYSIAFSGPNDKLLGLTDPSHERITIYLRPSQSTGDIAHVLGHEIAHAVDFTMTTDTERAEYRRIRGLDDRPWYPTCGLCPDYTSPVGDWAETFAYWLLGGTFNSQLAGRPSPAQLAALKPIFTADAAVTPTTTTTGPPVTSPAPKPTTAPTTTARSGGTTPVYWYWYGGGFRRTSPPDSSDGSGGRTRRGG